MKKIHILIWLQHFFTLKPVKFSNFEGLSINYVNTSFYKQINKSLYIWSNDGSFHIFCLSKQNKNEKIPKKKWNFISCPPLPLLNNAIEPHISRVLVSVSCGGLKAFGLHTCPALTPSPSVQSTHVPPPPAREISTADQWWIWFLYGFYSILFSPFESFLSELHSNYKLTLGWLTVFHKKCLVNKFFGANSWTSYFRGLFKVAIFIQEKTDFVLFFFFCTLSLGDNVCP